MATTLRVGQQPSKRRLIPSRGNKEPPALHSVLNGPWTKPCVGGCYTLGPSSPVHQVQKLRKSGAMPPDNVHCQLMHDFYQEFTSFFFGLIDWIMKPLL
jgi:hypothetical protein